MTARNAWITMLISYLCVLGLMLISTFSAAPESLESQSDIIISGLIFWGLKSIPLFLFIPGLIKKSHYAASWLSYTTMLYFVVSIALGTGIWLWAQAIALIALFLSSMLFTRWKKAENKS